MAHSIVKSPAFKNMLKFRMSLQMFGRDIHITKVRSNVTTADMLPIPKNIDVTESVKFSPLRNREMSATVILTQCYQRKSSTKTDIIMENCSSQKLDPHVQSYDCLGTICLNSTMQSNVPTPFGGMHKFTHLNMPGGQWSQHYKFMSANLQSSHYAMFRKQARFYWSTYNKEGIIPSNTDLPIAWTLHNKRNYCNKLDKSDEDNQARSKKDQLKKAFKHYGSTIVIFHVAISLVSLGGFYLLISSGVDLIALLESLGFPLTGLRDGIAIGATNFVISYAIHKIFAPVRISITLTAAPFIVRYLRSKGLIKSNI